MIFENEKKLLLIIRYAPSVFIISISFFLLAFFYIENTSNFEKEKKQIQIEHLKKSKELIKEQVDSVYDYIQRERASTENELKHTLKEAIRNAHKIAMTIYTNNQDKPKEEIQQLIRDALRNIRFNNGRGYYFVYDKTGKSILNPISPYLEGKNFLNYKDLKGTYLVKKSIRLLSQNDEAFYEWYWRKPGTKEGSQNKKIGFIKNFEPYNWMFGTGEYIEDFEKEVQERILKNVREIRFGKNGYIFIISYDSIYLSHLRKNFIGKKTKDTEDIAQTDTVISELLNLAQKGDGYYSYIQNKKIDNDKASKKISYVKGLNDWNWAIGTGFYEDDINKEIKEKKDNLDEKLSLQIKNTLVITIILTIALLFISLYVSKTLFKMFASYKKDIQKHIDENIKNQNILAQQSKMFALGEMVNNIAHQWRQPLSIISTSASGMKAQKELDLLKDEALLKGLDNINNASQYLSKTIDNFRYIISTDDKKTYFKLKNTLEKTLSFVLYGSDENNINIIKNYEEIELNNYENDLIQVLLNLVNYSKDTLNKIDEKILFIETKKQMNKTTIIIQNNMGKIEEKTLEKIFEIDLNENKKTDTNSLGLFSSKEIITKKLEGSINITNSTFIHKDKTHLGMLIKIEFTH